MAEQCRRCDECRVGPHHWLDNPDLGNDPGEADYPTGVEYICKHCPAVGISRPDGEIDECEPMSFDELMEMEESDG
jgi:hypothetical protein